MDLRESSGPPGASLPDAIPGSNEIEGPLSKSELVYVPT